MTGKMRKGLFTIIGVLFTALGVVGAFLPVLPTVPFLLVAAWAFANSSERLHRWLLEHARLGPPLKAWQEQRAIPARGKLLAVGSMGITSIWLLAFAPLAWWVVALSLAIIAYGAWFVLSRPTLK